MNCPGSNIGVGHPSGAIRRMDSPAAISSRETTRAFNSPALIKRFYLERNGVTRPHRAASRRRREESSRLGSASLSKLTQQDRQVGEPGIAVEVQVDRA